jgi:hypothetical protein
MYQSASVVPVLPLIQGILSVSLLAGFIVFFKPLLTGVVRALVLLVRPRLSKDELSARRRTRDAKMLQRMINSSQGPSHAAELRALGSRA